jgi:hypothetical protein
MTSEDVGPKHDPVARHAEIMQELAARLRPVCGDWPDELFTSMIQQLAAITLKYEDPKSVSAYDRRTTDRLVADLRNALRKSEDSRDRGDA